MNGTSRWLLGGVVALAVAGAAFGLPALAAETETPQAPGFGRMGAMMQGRMGAMMSGDMAAMHSQMAPMMEQMGAMRDQVMGDVAGLLGMSLEELNQAMASGKSLAALAEEKKVAEGEIRATMTKGMKAQLDALVAAGTLTQAQAAQMLAMHEQNFGGCFNGGGMMGGSMMGGGMRGMMFRNGASY